MVMTLTRMPHQVLLSTPVVVLLHSTTRRYGTLYSSRTVGKKSRSDTSLAIFTQQG